MIPTKYDFEFEPVRRECEQVRCAPDMNCCHGSRLIVASEDDWARFKIACLASDEKYQQLKILLQCETAFSGDDGPILEHEVHQQIVICHGCGKWLGQIAGNDNANFAPQFDESCGGSNPKCERIPRALTLSDIQTRLFRATEGSKAEIWLDVGENLKTGYLWNLPYDAIWGGAWRGIHLITTESNRDKAEAIKHLVQSVNFRI